MERKEGVRKGRMEGMKIGKERPPAEGMEKLDGRFEGMKKVRKEATSWGWWDRRGM